MKNKLLKISVVGNVQNMKPVQTFHIFIFQEVVCQRKTHFSLYQQIDFKDALC